MSSGYSPADVLRAALTQVGVGVGARPSGVPAGQPLVWPVWVNHLPDQPDNAICVYDTAGRREGRLQGTGESITKPGWQIRVRALDHHTAYDMMITVQSFLDSIRNLEVDIGTAAYTIAAVTQTGGVLALGQEPEAARRNNLTLNGTITHMEITP